MNAPLSGIRVIEFCRGAAGAYCGLLLADMGADVILVDDPVDDIVNDSASTPGEPAQLGLRRNKRSVALDLLTLEGRSLAHALVRGADVVIECLPSGTLTRAGLGYDALADVQPHLVYVSISAFGQDGPRSSAQPGVPALDALRGMLGAAPSGSRAATRLACGRSGCGALRGVFRVGSAGRRQAAGPRGAYRRADAGRNTRHCRTVRGRRRRSGRAPGRSGACGGFGDVYGAGYGAGPDGRTFPARSGAGRRARHGVATCVRRRWGALRRARSTVADVPGQRQLFRHGSGRAGPLACHLCAGASRRSARRSEIY